MDGEISPDEVRTLLEDDPASDVRIVDIRDATSFERGHLPDSENVPFRELPDRIREFDGAERVVTVCPHGKASVQAARLIGSYEGAADARVESMAGGLKAWAERYDLVSSADADDSSENAASADEDAADSDGDVARSSNGTGASEADGTAESSDGTPNAPF